MKRYKVEMIRDVSRKYYYIRDMETMEILMLPAKYLTHKIKANRSPQYGETFSICSIVLYGIFAGKGIGNYRCV